MAAISLLAGCATNDGSYSSGYGYGHSRYAYGYGYDPYYDHPYYSDGPTVGVGFGFYDGFHHNDDGRHRSGGGGTRPAS
jgi:hypothetical protein